MNNGVSRVLPIADLNENYFCGMIGEWIPF